jgi:hypothetical protein
MPNTVAVTAEELIPSPERSVVAISAPGKSDGYWAGASSAVYDNGIFYLAYRARGPLGQGRGFGLVVAKSGDGIHFETIAQLAKADFGAESLERPALVKTPDGLWRLYVSCATPGTKHWWISMVEAESPAEFNANTPYVVVPGYHYGVKDPVVKFYNGQWLMWATFHPLDQKDEEDRMDTRLGTSLDGIGWHWSEPVLRGRPGMWDSRGARVTAVRLSGDNVTAFYDGRASKLENYEERTGIATGTLGHLEAMDEKPVAEAAGRMALRYLDLVDVGEGSVRLYYELHLPDGSHELRTELREA